MQAGRDRDETRERTKPRKSPRRKAVAGGALTPYKS